MPRAALVVSGCVLIALLGLLHNTADGFADRIKRGQRVEPFRLPILVFDLELLALRGEPTVVRSLDPKLAVLRELEQTRERLIYIGQAKGVAVVYAPLRQRVLFIPSSAALIVTTNCETRHAKDEPQCRLYETPLPRGGD